MGQKITSRRRSDRCTAEFPLEFDITDGQGRPISGNKSREGVTLDVSKHGLSFIAEQIDETQLPELVDGMVMLALTVTLPDNKRSTLLARVAWANKFDNDSGGRYFIGVDFVSGDGIDALYKAAKSFSV